MIIRVNINSKVVKSLNRIDVQSVKVSDNRIEVSFDVSGEQDWLDCFVEPYVEITEYETSIDGVPESVAVLPFVSNMLPMIWVFDAVLHVNEIDKSFYESIPEFKKGFIKMYSQFELKGTVEADSVIENHSGTDGSILLFSGGADAFYTLISILEQKPVLLTVWGADLYTDNPGGWANIESHVKKSANNLELESVCVKTNFRLYTSRQRLDETVKAKNPKLNWYHDFQHGPVLLCLAAPLAYKRGAGRVYISSSFTPDLIGNYFCASDPTIDNYMRYSDTQVIHHGYESNRQEKIHKICEFNSAHNNIIDLRVCFDAYNGTNCCICEKCCRTMLAIIADGCNPANYGFELYDEEQRKKIIYKLKHVYRPQFQYNRYHCIQEHLRERYTLRTCPKDLKWFYVLKLHRSLPWYYRIFNKLKKAVRSLIK